METSMAMAGLVSMQMQGVTSSLAEANYKNDAFYNLMQQTADSSSKTESSSAKKDTSSTKQDTVEKTEAPEKEEVETTEPTDQKDTKENMTQQLDLAMTMMSMQSNVVTAETGEQAVLAEGQQQGEQLGTVTAMEQTAEGALVQGKQEETVVVPEQKATVQTKQTTQETPKEMTAEKAVEAQPQQQTKTEVTKQQETTETTATTTEEPVVEQTVKTESEGTNTETASEEETPTETFHTSEKKQSTEDFLQIKVGEGQQITDPNAAQKISDKMLAKFAQHENEFEIQLTPKELGKIVIKLVMENGQAHVTMSAANSKTMSLLAEHAREIGLIIQQNTGNETNVEVVDQKTMENQNQKEDEKGDGYQRQQEEQQRQHQEKLRQAQASNFIQQMRLGLWETV